jgi:hypothetical protein
MLWYFLPFALSIFIGSFLLFQVQPIISKYILPWFGGTSAVWTTAMLFFQTFLLLGYAYILVLAKVTLKKQIAIHAVVVVGICLAVWFLSSTWASPILPDASWKPDESISPIWQVLSILTVSVGLPYFLLSTTSVLLQKWFSLLQSKRSPYPLYALSNVASLLALLSYPFLIEPFLPLQLQGIWWGIGFGLYALFLLICCGQTLVLAKKQKTKPSAKHISITKKTAGTWLFLSATATLMLLAITSIQTQSIAPIPFLWILPLSLYLLSFIICFSGTKWYWRNFYAYLFFVTAPLVLVFSLNQAPSIFFGILVYSLALFSCCMLCHGELYHLKPHPSRLDTFYVLVALGSVISGIFVGIIAPLIFKAYWEIYVGFYASFFVALVVLLHYKNSLISRKLHVFFTSEKEVYICFGIGFPLIIVGLLVAISLVNGDSSIKYWRSFYGVITVKERRLPNTTQKTLVHGNIIHGVQYTSGDLRYKPLAYFGEPSGIGLTLRQYQKEKKTMRVGILGLGIGTLAAYGRKGDTYVFYEIHPQVKETAYNEFTYLKDSKAKTNVILGDGRLELEKQPTNPKYDVLILDAFSDDAIPVHLLTKEAFAMYLNHIDPKKGVIAVNISNNFVNLRPLLVQVAKQYGLSYAIISSKASGNNLQAEWGILTKDKAFLNKGTIGKQKERKQYKTVALWTDDYSNLFQILK